MMRLTSGHCVGRGLGEVNRLFEDRHRLGQHLRVRRVDRREKLPAFYARAAPRMEQNARVRIDRLAGLLAPRAGALHGPAQRGGIHLRHVAALPRVNFQGRARLVERLHIVEDGDIAALRVDHLHKGGKSGAIGERRFRQRVTGLEALRLCRPGGSSIRRE